MWDKYQSRSWHIRVEKKLFRRRRILMERKNRPKRRVVNSFGDKNFLGVFLSLILAEFKRKKYIETQFVKRIIIVPEKFSYEDNFNECVRFFKELLSSYILGAGHVTLDFSKCKKTDISTFSMLNVFLSALEDFKRGFNRNKFNIVDKEFHFITSMCDMRTNKYLHAFKYHTIDQKYDVDECKFKTLDLISGKGKDTYRNNQKSKVSKMTTEFVQSAINEIGYSLNQEGINNMDGFVTEILSNAEDHSLANSEWYVNGIAFHERQHGVEIVELNLSIINIGLSMFEGFEGTKRENFNQYQKLEDSYNKHRKQFLSVNQFEKESLFMLYMLNEGISRLKFKEKSRGNGTMNFIRSFLDLGSFGDQNTDFRPRLNIISGHSVLTCDNVYKPYPENNFWKISLNQQQNQGMLPDKKYISYFEEHFPGTIMECKIYFNKDYTKNLISD